LKKKKKTSGTRVYVNFIRKIKKYNVSLAARLLQSLCLKD